MEFLGFQTKSSVASDWNSFGFLNEIMLSFEKNSFGLPYMELYLASERNYFGLLNGFIFVIKKNSIELSNWIFLGFLNGNILSFQSEHLGFQCEYFWAKKIFWLAFWTVFFFFASKRNFYALDPKSYSFGSPNEIVWALDWFVGLPNWILLDLRFDFFSLSYRIPLGHQTKSSWTSHWNILGFRMK